MAGKDAAVAAKEQLRLSVNQFPRTKFRGPGQLTFARRSAYDIAQHSLKLIPSPSLPA